MTIGYKAFNNDMTCSGFQFEIGKTYEEKNISMCEKGFHFCLNPLDCLSYYDLTESIFCEVESLGNELKHDEDSKICTDKIKITKKISHNEFIKLSESFLFDNCNNKDAASGDGAKLAASGYRAQLAASGDWAVVAAIGANSKAKAKKGSFIVLAEYENGIPTFVKSRKVDGKIIKEDTFYKLENGKFVVAE